MRVRWLNPELHDASIIDLHALEYGRIDDGLAMWFATIPQYACEAPLDLRLGTTHELSRTMSDIALSHKFRTSSSQATASVTFARSATTSPLR